MDAACFIEQRLGFPQLFGQSPVLVVLLQALAGVRPQANLPPKCRLVHVRSVEQAAPAVQSLTHPPAPSLPEQMRSAVQQGAAPHVPHVAVQVPSVQRPPDPGGPQAAPSVVQGASSAAAAATQALLAPAPISPPQTSPLSAGQVCPAVQSLRQMPAPFPACAEQRKPLGQPEPLAQLAKHLP